MGILQNCEELVLHAILSKVGARHSAQLSCLCKSLRDAASDDNIWASFCLSDFDVSTPHDPNGNTCPSFKATYKTWQESFGMYPLPLVKRVKLCWDTIKNWTAVNFPELSSTLQRGASEALINEMEEILRLKFPLPTRVIYRFVNGQEVADFDSFRSVQSASLGLIGGYCFYGHAVNVHLLPLSEIFRKTKQLSALFCSTRKSKCIVVAASSNLNKFFFLDCTDGQLYVDTERLANGEMMPCVPSALIKSVHNINDAQQQDAMLLWLEEYSRRLQNGMYSVRKEENIRSISLYPECPPLCSTATTNGVQVRASAVFVPEDSDPQSTKNKYLFSYSIRMRLLSRGNILDGTYLTSCQLYWRHWIIRANGTVVSDVSDKAVIGKYPLLYVDGEEFVYESCTMQPSSSGSVEGAFTFVPGSLKNPKGRPFDVEVAQFSVNLPGYIF